MKLTIRLQLEQSLRARAASRSRHYTSWHMNGDYFPLLITSNINGEYALHKKLRIWYISYKTSYSPMETQQNYITSDQSTLCT